MKKDQMSRGKGGFPMVESLMPRDICPRLGGKRRLGSSCVSKASLQHVKGLAQALFTCSCSFWGLTAASGFLNSAPNTNNNRLH